MTRIRRTFSKEQKLEIVKMSLEPEVSVKSLSERFDISQNAIYNWRSRYYKYKESSFSGHGNKTMTPQEREISNLKKALREAQLERDILKKAVSIFSTSDSKFSNL